jgi:hypothetical protein
MVAAKASSAGPSRVVLDDVADPVTVEHHVKMDEERLAIDAATWENV